MRTPRAAERLLSGFFADPDLEEAVLGDLAEEWGERVLEDGERAADAWYREQAVGSARHLLALWWRTADAREFRGTLVRTALALAAALLLLLLTTDTLPIGGGPPGSPPGSRPDAIALGMIASGAAWALLAAFVSTRRTLRAPMAATALLALGWIPATVVPAAAFPTPPGAPGWLYLAFPAATALATAVGGTVATLLRRADGSGRTRTDSSTSTLEAAMTTKTQDTPFRRRAARVAVVTALLLAVPLVAMQLTGEVDWNWFDFVFAGTLLMGVGLAYEFAAAKTGDSAYRAAVGIALAATLLLVWVNGAVGIIGTEGDPANLMYAGVLAVALAGAVGARFESRGMARAMFTTAAAQALVGAIAIVYGLGAPASGPLELAAANGFWIALWLGSAWLFRRASVNTVPAPAEAEG